MNLRKLEEVLMEGMAEAGEKTAKNFGVAKRLRDKKIEAPYANPAAEALTETDLENQETLLHHLYKSFPQVAISVEERINDPTPVQKSFYENDESAEYLVQIDPIDGTFIYAQGKIREYGIITSVVERKTCDQGVFVFSIIYYPSLEFFIIANHEKVAKIKRSGEITPLSKETAPQCSRQEYSASFVDPPEKLGLPKEVPYVRDIYSATQAVLYVTNGRIPGYLKRNAQTIDALAAAWIAHQWGADVEFASGEKLHSVPFGDIKTPEGRKLPRDQRGLLIIGKKSDAYFKKYADAYQRHQGVS